MTRKNKSASFNTNDLYEEKLLAWAESEDRGIYSKYIKRLIARDMEGWERRPEAALNSTPILEETVNDFSGFI